MPIYRKVISNQRIIGPSSLTDIQGLSPIEIQSGQSGYSFVATLSISGLNVLPNPDPNWGAKFQILQGTNVLATHWMGALNGGFQPSFTLTTVGDVNPTGLKEKIYAKWMVSGNQTEIRERASFSIIWDQREDC